MRFKYLISFIAIICLFIVTACGSNTTNTTPNEPQNSSSNNNSSQNSQNAEPEEQVVLRLAHDSAESSLYHIPAVKLAELVEEKTNGSVKIEIFPSAQLGAGRDLIENVRNGSIDMSWIAVADFDAITPVFRGFQFPFLITDYEVAYEVFNSEVAQKAIDELEEYNLKGLGMIEVDLRNFGVSGDTEIRTPEDFKGLKIRAPGNSMLLDSFAALGINATSIPYPDIYNGMQTGVIDGFDTPLVTWWTDGFYEVVDSISIMNWYPWPVVPSINLDTFNNLSESQQQAMLEAMEETKVYLRGVVEEMVPQVKQDLQDAGVTIVEDINLEPFEELVEPIYDDYADEHPIIRETIDTVEQIKAELNK